MSAAPPIDPGAKPPFDLIFFDCDSTLSAVEGIDELARGAGLEREIAALTRAAMEGAIPLEDVYGRRLALVKPSRTAVEALARTYVEREVPGARELIAALHALGKRVHVISGGLRPAVLPLARELGVDDARVHAVAIRFDASGGYAGFDEDSPLARTGGKATVCAEVLAREPGRAAIVGDGKTDIEARPPCAAAIGFGGVEARAVVRELADAWVAGPSLLDALEPLSTAEERARLR